MKSAIASDRSQNGTRQSSIEFSVKLKKKTLKKRKRKTWMAVL